MCLYQRAGIVHAFEEERNTGRIQPVTQVNISADVSAKITRLAVKEGDWVEKGQFLLELDRERYVAEVESAEANLRSSEAEAAVGSSRAARRASPVRLIACAHAMNTARMAAIR